MILYNRIHGTHPCVVHALGKPEDSPLWDRIVDAMPRRRLNFPPDPRVSFITWNTGGPGQNHKRGIMKLGTFEWSADLFGCPVTVLARGDTGWCNWKKFEYVSRFAEAAKTEYIAAFDSSDVLIVSPPEQIVEKFETFGCEMLFNGQRLPWPPDIDLGGFEEKIGVGPIRFLNSGVWIGRTEYVRWLAKNIYTLVPRMTKYPLNEQPHVRVLYPREYPKMKVDCRSVVFQSLNRVGPDELEIVPPKLL